MINKLTTSHIMALFEETESGSNILQKSENNTIEYKQSFHFDPKVMKTCAAFANNQGGYIIFGVHDVSRELKGLSERQIKKFDQYDLKDATEQLNSYFTPNIHIDKRTHKFRGKYYGIICIYEANEKPIIATKNKDNTIRDGEIYYSYDARREKIKYTELRNILENQEKRKLERFFKQLEMIMKIGVDNSAIMNTESGEVIGPKIKNFIIEESLLAQLKFIREGEFNEVTGQPTIKVIGQLQARGSSGEFQSYRVIHKDDIFRAFVYQEPIANPDEFIKQIYNDSRIYVPIYYYAYLADMTTLDDIINFSDTLDVIQNHTFVQIKGRLSTTDDLHQDIKYSDTPAYHKKIYGSG